MKKTTVLIIGAVAGLVIGYLVFAKTGNSYIELKTLVLPAKNALVKALNKIGDLNTVRIQILACGAAGAILSMLLFRKKK